VLLLEGGLSLELEGISLSLKLAGVGLGEPESSEEQFAKTQRIEQSKISETFLYF